MSFLHDWKRASPDLASEYVACMQTGDTKRCREIRATIHAGNKRAQVKNPGAIARLLGFIKGAKEMPK